jgi:hypothetical protein
MLMYLDESKPSMMALYNSVCSKLQKDAALT